MEKITLRQVFGDYIIDRKIKPKSVNQTYNLINNCLGAWWYLHIGAITEEMVERRFKEIESKTAPQADACFRRFRAIYNYAAAKYKNFNVPRENPTRILSDLKLWRRAKARKNYIKKYQMKVWMWSVLMETNTTCRDYLITLLLTGFRHSEACELEWSNIDLEHGFITAKDTKNGHDHTVPMCQWLWEIMLERKSKAKNKWVFPAHRPGIRTTGVKGKGNFTTPYGIITSIEKKTSIHFRPHDLRRTWNNIAKRLNVSEEKRKAVLNHTPQDVTGRHYDVYEPEEVRETMELVCREILMDSELLGRQKLTA